VGLHWQFILSEAEGHSCTFEALLGFYLSVEKSGKVCQSLSFNRLRILTTLQRKQTLVEKNLK
jgi:hypothetical protein